MARSHPVDVHVGARMRQRRTLLGMSQEKLGTAVGLTFQQIQKYERGSNRIGSSRLFEFSKVLDVPVAYFFDEMPSNALAGRPILDKDGWALFVDYMHKEPAWHIKGNTPLFDASRLPPADRDTLVEYLGKKVVCQHCSGSFLAWDPEGAPAETISASLSGTKLMDRAQELIEMAEQKIAESRIMKIRIDAGTVESTR